MYILNQILGDADRILFNPDERDNCAEPYVVLQRELASLGYRCTGVKDQSIDEVAWVLFWDIDSAMPNGLFGQFKYRLRQKRIGGSARDILGEARNRAPLVRTALLMFEPPTVSPRNWDLSLHELFDVIFTWDPRFVDGAKYRQIYLPSPVEFPRAPPQPFAVRKLLVDVSSNKRIVHPKGLSDFRYETICYFARHHPDQFDLYGFGWNPPLSKWILMSLKGSRTYRHPIAAYRGPARQKSLVYSQYRFCICYENMADQPGYVSVKILDAIRSGCVPVYLGAPDIERYIPPDTYIDRRQFANNAALHDFLSKMSEAEHVERVRAGVRAFETGAVDRFLSPYFARSIIEGLGLKRTPTS